MFNYTEAAKVAANKFSTYTEQQCRYAIKDCTETLQFYDHENPYAKKLWVEIDAARDRLMEIERNRNAR